MTEKDVTFSLQCIKNLLEVLAVRITRIHLNSIHGNNLMLSFETNAGAYEISCVWNGTLREEFILKNTFLIKQIATNRFSYNVIKSIIFNMTEAKDTDAIENLFVALCTFWDQLFIQASKALPLRVASALCSLKRIIYKNPAGEMDPYPWCKHPELFIFFVTGPIGNQLYYLGQLHKRKDLQRIVQGEIW